MSYFVYKNLLIIGFHICRNLISQKQRKHLLLNNIKK